MTKYIWITMCLISLILILGFKQIKNEPELERPLEKNISDNASEEESSYTVSESGNIKISNPVQGEKISSPLLVKGEARVFENAFSIRLKDSSGKIIVEKNAMANAPDIGEFGSFGELLLFDEGLVGDAVLEVYSNSAKDGAEQDLVSIPLKF